MKKINHIGIAVKDLNKSVKTYENMGFRISDTDEVKDQKVKVAFIDIGESRLELLEPTDDNSPIKKFLDKKGEGIHHIAFQVENLEQILAEYKKKGIKLIDKKPRKGAHGLKIAFVHPKSTDGVLVELCE